MVQALGIFAGELLASEAITNEGGDDRL